MQILIQEETQNLNIIITTDDMVTNSNTIDETVTGTIDETVTNTIDPKEKRYLIKIDES